jgi:hypothetical protein
MQEYLKDKNTSPIALLNKRCNIWDVAALELSEATKSPNRQRIWRRTNNIAVGNNFTGLSSAVVR